MSWWPNNCQGCEKKGRQAEQGMSGFCVDNNDGNTEGPECGAKKQSEALPGVSINNITVKDKTKQVTKSRHGVVYSVFLFCR